MKLAVIGANGQLGSELVLQAQDAGHTVKSLTHDDLEISDQDSVARVIGEIGPDWIFNTAAYHNVPKCEENVIRTFEINAQGALNLAKVCADSGAKLLNYSTDYVFDGAKAKPYVEEDNTNPLNVYAVSKLAGENLVRNYCSKAFVVRLSGIYGKVACRAKGSNFVQTMIRLADEREVVRVVTDEILTPTSVVDIAANSLELINSDHYGLYHMTCQGECSWYDFAQVIFDQLKLPARLEPTTVAEFASPVKRPFYSVLENQNLKKINLDRMSNWRDALLKHLQSIG